MRWCAAILAPLLLVFVGTSPAQDIETPPELDKPQIEPYALDFTGGGARAEGMGRAFIGVSDDITAGSWNPAGLFVLEKPVMAVSYGALAPRGSTSAKFFRWDASLDHSGSFDDLTSANFIAPVRLKGHQFVGSFSFTRNFDEFQISRSTWFDSIFVITFGQLDTVEQSNGLTSELQGGLNSVNIGFGTRLYEKLSFGAAVNVYSGSVTRDIEQVSATDSFPDFIYSGNYIKRTIYASVIDSNKFSGVNVTVGFKLNTDKVDVGLVVRTPFSLKVGTDRSIYYIQENSGPVIGVPRKVFSDTTYFDDLKAKYGLPLMVAVGVGYHPSDKFLWAADIEYRNYSSSDVDLRDSILIDPGGSNTEYFTEEDPGWKNVFIVRSGVEHLRETPIGTVPLRAGIGYVPLPVASRDVGGKRSLTTSLNFSLGTGLHWSQIHLDLAYTFTSISWEGPLNVLGQNIGFGEMDSRNHHLNFTFTGYF